MTDHDLLIDLTEDHNRRIDLTEGHDQNRQIDLTKDHDQNRRIDLAEDQDQNRRIDIVEDHDQNRLKCRATDRHLFRCDYEQMAAEGIDRAKNRRRAAYLLRLSAKRLQPCSATWQFSSQWKTTAMMTIIMTSYLWEEHSRHKAGALHQQQDVMAMTVHSNQGLYPPPCRRQMSHLMRTTSFEKLYVARLDSYLMQNPTFTTF